jgi:hypothetical protein
MLSGRAKNGGTFPTRNRSCTDIICAILFFLVTAASFVAAFYGFKNGNLSNIVPPYDSSGNRCGQDTHTDYPFLYFKSTKASEWVDATACVKSCPKLDTDTIECEVNDQITDCAQLPVRASYSFGNRFCWPKDSEMEAATREKFATLGKQEAYGDIVDSW